MKVLRGRFGLLALSVIAVIILAACPLPYAYNGKGAGGNQTSDPSSPKMTSVVTVSYVEEGGATGTIADNGSVASGKATTVTLSTATDNSVIYYTDDGTTITSVDAAKKFTDSSGSITIPRTAALQTMKIHAIAIGPNMLPSLPVSVTVVVSPYPVLTITRDKASVTEDGETATFTITSSSAAPAAGIAVSIQTSGGYDAGHVSFPTQNNSTLTATIQPNATTTTLGVAGVYNSDHVNQTITLTIQPDSGNPPLYTVGTPSIASVVVQDDGTNTVTYNGNGNTGGTAPTDANRYAPNATVTVLGSGSLVRTGYAFSGWNTQANGGGTAYTANQTFTMPGSNVILYAQWTALPPAATPTFSPGGGTYTSAQTVTISSATSGATIRYTTDGTTPSETAGTVIPSGQQITVSSYTVLQAIAYGPGLADSAVATATYTVLSSFAGPWTFTNNFPEVLGVYGVELIGTDTYHFINNSGIVFSGIYQKQGNTMVMITPDNPNYTGFIWTIDSQTHLTLSNTSYAGATMTR